jgi:hypothetical protein
MDGLGVNGGVIGGVISPTNVGSSLGVINCGCLTSKVGCGTSLVHPFVPDGMALAITSRSLCSSRSFAQAARLL